MTNRELLEIERKMCDRGLLEMAAKAAGARYCGHSSTFGLLLVAESERHPNRWWNPLDDDGDALRLAVALSIVVDCSGHPSAYRPGQPRVIWVDEVGDRATLTRRAIVLCAAEIGRTML